MHRDMCTRLVVLTKFVIDDIGNVIGDVIDDAY